jgi:hypothetical protein
MNYFCEMEIDSLSEELTNLFNQIIKVPRIYFKMEQVKFSILKS